MKRNRKEFWTEPAEGFDFAGMDARLVGYDPDKAARGPTRSEAAAWLKRLGIPPEDCAVIVGKAFGDTLRKIAADLDRSHTWASQRAKAHRDATGAIRGALRRDEPLPAPTGKPPKPARRGGIGARKPLHRLARWAAEAVKMGSPENTLAGNLAQYRNQSPAVKAVAAGGPTCLPHAKPDAAGIVALIQANPERLLDPRWRGLLDGLVDILEAATSGDCKRRLPWLIGKGDRQAVAAQAREALQALGKAHHGRKLGLPDRLLAGIAWAFADRVRLLQSEYAPTLGQPRRQRLAAMRDLHPQELRGLSDRALQDLLTGDPVAVGCRLAADATGIHPDAYARAVKACRP